MNIIPWFTKELEKLISSSSVLIKCYGLYYRRIVEKEICLGRISCDDKVLCIGGGSVPSTAIEIAARTGAMVEVIDVDPRAVEIAKEVVSRLKMNNQIDIRLCSGQQVDCSNYSVIHVALQAHPQDKIISNLWKRARGGTRILMRQPKEMLKGFYCFSQKSIDNDYCYHAIPQKLCTMKETLLLMKGEGREKVEEVNITHSYSLNNSTRTILSRLQ